MGDPKVGTGSAAWALVESAVRTACMFATADARQGVCARLRALADELEQDGVADVRDGVSVGGRHRR